LIRHPQFYEAKQKLLDRGTISLADDETSMTAPNDLAVRRALEMAGVEFIDKNGGGPGVRLRNRQGQKRLK
jgi:hypothetical protein